MINYKEAINYAIKNGQLNIEKELSDAIWPDAPERWRKMYLANILITERTAINKRFVSVFEEKTGLKFDFSSEKFLIPGK